MRFIPVLLALLFSVSLNSSVWGQKPYQELMDDPSVNFYDVFDAAEQYFSTRKAGEEGSGRKGFERWRSRTEYKFYPSGDRSQADPFFAERAYARFLAENPVDPSAKLFNNGWNELGPYVVDSITGHYAPGLGRVEDVWVDPTNANRIYLGSRSGGFWKTTDGGANWTGGTTDFLVASGVNTIGVSPTNPDSILINVRNANNGYSHGIYRSTDGGVTWTQSNFNPTNVGFGGLGSNFIIYRIAFHPTIPNLVFVGTNKGLYRSTNNLSTWTQIYTSGQYYNIKFHPTNPSIVYTYNRSSSNSARDYVLRSADTGQTFVSSNQIPGNNNTNRGRIKVSPDCPDCVFFGSGNGVWKSTDGGINFTFLSNPNSSCDGYAVSDTDTSHMVYGYVDLFTSNNGGQNFNQETWWYLGDAAHGNGSLSDNFDASQSYIHADMRVARCVNGVFYVGTDGYLGKSTDNGATWSYISQGTPIRENYRCGTSQSNHYQTLAGSQDNGTSLRVEEGWVEVFGADGMECLVHPLNPDLMMWSYQWGGRLLTQDRGDSYTYVNPPGQSGSGNADWIAPMMIDPNDHLRIYTFSDSILRTDDFGESGWSFVGTPGTFTGFVNRAAIAHNNSNILVATRSDDIEKTTDGGLTWSSISTGLPNSYINDIAFDPRNDDVMVVVYGTYQNNGQKVFQTTNGGQSWTNITANLNDMPIRSVVIDHTDSSNIYLGAEIGVFVKSMAGTNWVLYNSNLPNVAVNDLKINWGSNTLKAATWGRGLWEYSLKDRLDHPAILYTEIDKMPTMTQPSAGLDQPVNSVISYDGNLSSVYVKWSVGAPTFGNTIAMTNTVDSTWQTATPIPGQAIGTKVYFKGSAVGANQDTTETYKFMYEGRPLGYCNAVGSPGTGSDYIDFVRLETLANSSGQDYYGNFTNQYVELWADSTYTLQVDLNFSFPPDTAAAWIDYDRDGEFEPSEEIDMGSFSTAHTSFGTFTVPSNASFDDTVVMRVRNVYLTTPNEVPLPCGEAPGEVEDYSVILRSACISQTTFSVTQCDPYTWPVNGQTYTSSGTYDVVFTNNQGCDSTLTLNLTVAQADTAVTITGNTLTATATGSTFQWLDCGNGNAPIAGATNATFSPSATGTYAVQVTQGTCVDTSACIAVVVVGVAPEASVRIYPNPNSGRFVIDLGERLPEASVTITDAVGRQIGEFSYRDQQLLDVRLRVASGTYFVEIDANGRHMVVPVIIEEE